MITRADIVERVGEWGLAEQVVEKDYVLGWLLWGIATDPTLGQSWIFKGGTCLKKCYIETYRFSEDLDFTVLPGGPHTPDDVRPLIERVLARVYGASGVNFWWPRTGSACTSGRPVHRGQRLLRGPPGSDRVAGPDQARHLRQRKGCSAAGLARHRASIPGCSPGSGAGALLLLRGTVRRKASRDGPAWPAPGPVRHHQLISAQRSTAVPDPDLRRTRREVRRQGHFGPDRPLDPFLEELPLLFRWLDGSVVLDELPPPVYDASEDDAWSPPRTAWTWRAGVPIEVIRFAATNHLLVDLTYGGRRRLIEPYSLRRTRDGSLLLHAERADNSGHRSYRIDRMEGAAATTTPFTPRAAIEFSAQGSLQAPLQSRRVGGYPTAHRSRPAGQIRTGPIYLYQCNRCGRTFEHSAMNTTLRPHKDGSGSRCSGRIGHYVGIR